MRLNSSRQITPDLVFVVILKATPSGLLFQSLSWAICSCGIPDFLHLSSSWVRGRFNSVSLPVFQIPVRSFHVSKHELSGILITQDQDPDDLCPLYPHGVPREFGLTSSVFNQVLVRFYSKCQNHPSFSMESYDHTLLLTCLSLKHPISELCAWRFLFVVYGFKLLVRVCPMSLVLVLVVADLISCVSSRILSVTLYISFCMHHLPKRHMICT